MSPLLYEQWSFPPRILLFGSLFFRLGKVLGPPVDHASFSSLVSWCRSIPASRPSTPGGDLKCPLASFPPEEDITDLHEVYASSTISSPPLFRGY